MSAWREELEASKRRLAPPGPLPLAEIADWPGERIFAAIGAGELPSPEFAVAAGIHPIEVGGGRAVFQGDPSQAFRNIMGAAHGGWIATLLDTALAVAVHATLPPRTVATTVEMKVNYVATVTEKTGPVRAIATVLSSGRTLATSEAKLVDESGRLYAHATETVAIVPVRPPH